MYISPYSTFKIQHSKQYYTWNIGYNSIADNVFEKICTFLPVKPLIYSFAGVLHNSLDRLFGGGTQLEFIELVDRTAQNLQAVLELQILLLQALLRWKLREVWVNNLYTGTR
jgi:hypothetical protein